VLLKEAGWPEIFGVPGALTPPFPDTPDLDLETRGPYSTKAGEDMLRLLSLVYEPNDEIRVPKTSSFGYPLPVKGAKDKHILLSYLRSINIKERPLSKITAPHDAAQRQQFGDAFGRVRQVPVQGVMMDANPYDSQLAKYGLQRARVRTPKGVSLAHNCRGMAIAQGIKWKKIPRMDSDPKRLSLLLNQDIDQGYRHVVLWDWPNAEYSHSPKTIALVDRWCGWQGQLFALHTDWPLITKGNWPDQGEIVTLTPRYHGNLSGIWSVLISNMVETAARLGAKYDVIGGLLGTAKFRLYIKGDDGCALFKTEEEAVEFRNYLESGWKASKEESYLSFEIVKVKKNGRWIYGMQNRAFRSLQKLMAPEFDWFNQPYKAWGLIQKWNNFFKLDPEPFHKARVIEETILREFKINFDVVRPPDDAQAYTVHDFYRMDEPEWMIPHLFLTIPSSHYTFKGPDHGPYWR